MRRRHQGRVTAAAALLVFTCAPATSWARATEQQDLTARQVAERAVAETRVPRLDKTVDTFNAGNPDTVVTGIAVTMMATLDVLQRAAAGGKNLIITHEPTFYNHYGTTTDLEKEHDPVFTEKMKFIEANNLVVWRFHDYWHRRNPDGVLTGMVAALGWGPYQQKDAPIFVLPDTSLGGLAKRIKETLNAPVLRIIGDPAMKVTRVGLAPGFAGFDINRRLIQREDVQVEVIGEGHEWEIGAYAADAVTAGLDKGLVVIGHIPSEQAGMEECARWLKTFITDVPVEFVAAKTPYVSVP